MARSPPGAILAPPFRGDLLLTANKTDVCLEKGERAILPIRLDQFAITW